ncbi:hypothetical protein QH494_02610 [Sphingomonas sp. AR_OL41]|uniref:hypothetical protein n=1 Tax=Sphingomonas sp. AR_OL41 TaxID=3042729 RepID=UPI00247FCAF7|nr:hypothetical protein [Sphingomonas sp. AR_OL41]MDH7971061.1 hypothetical protein [Sphingomonas sp. AR_OL41]
MITPDHNQDVVRAYVAALKRENLNTRPGAVLFPSHCKRDGWSWCWYTTEDLSRIVEAFTVEQDGDAS